MNRPVQNSGRPNAIAVSAPPASGRTTPPNAAQNATLPTRRISTRSVSSPAMNISRITPISARSRSDSMSGPGAGPCAGSSALREHRPPEHVEHRGPEHQAGEDLAEDGGLADAIGRCARQLGRGDDQREHEEKLQEVGHRERARAGTDVTQYSDRTCPRAPNGRRPHDSTARRSSSSRPRAHRGGRRGHPRRRHRRVSHRHAVWTGGRSAGSRRGGPSVCGEGPAGRARHSADRGRRARRRQARGGSPPRTRLLARHFWPGPLTLLVAADARLAPAVHE